MGNAHVLGNWPTFTFFVKVGTTRSDVTAFLSRLSELFFRGRGRGTNQSMGRDQNENPGVGGMSPHLYKKRKGGPAYERYQKCRGD
jgi:hypothetical protein